MLDERDREILALLATGSQIGDIVQRVPKATFYRRLDRLLKIGLLAKQRTGIVSPPQDIKSFITPPQDLRMPTRCSLNCPRQNTWQWWSWHWLLSPHAFPVSLKTICQVS